MPKSKFRALKRGDVDFSDPQAVEPNVTYFEQSISNPEWMTVFQADEDGLFAEPQLDWRGKLLNKNTESIRNRRLIMPYNILTGHGTGSKEALPSDLQDSNNLWTIANNPDKITDLNIMSGSVATDLCSYVASNSTYGGNGADMCSAMMDLLDAMGRSTTSRRKGMTFKILEVNVDPANTGQYTDFSPTDPLQVTRAIYHLTQARDVVWGIWMRVVSGTAAIGHVGTMYKDNIPCNTRERMDVAPNWTNFTGYRPNGDIDPHSIWIEGTQNAVIQIAVPFVYNTTCELPLPVGYHNQPIL